MSCDPCRCGDCVQQATCQWCSRDLECKPREANSCSDGNMAYTVSGLKGRGRGGGVEGEGLRRRGGRGGAKEEGLLLNCTLYPISCYQ